MKILITQTRRDASNPKLAFFKGKVYKATVATNQPRAFRIVKSGVNIAKVFAERPDGQTMLLEKGDFVIKNILPHERNELIKNYLDSKIKPKHEKLVVPNNLILRENFRPMTDKELNNINLMYCITGTHDKGKCGKAAEFIRVFGPRVKTVCCLRHATIPRK